MPRLRHANGVTVEVPKEKVDGLLSRDFTAEPEKSSTTKAPAKKSASSKSGK